METKKILVPTIIAIATLVIMTVGATYAYFVVSTDTSEFTTSTVKATTPEVGSVALSTGSNLYLTLSRTNMTSANTGTYYAVTNSNGVSTKDTVVDPVAIATASVTGEGTYTCQYTLNVNTSGDLAAAVKSAAKTGVAVLKVGTQTYDLGSVAAPTTVTGTLTGLTKTAPKTIDAQFYFVNTDANQAGLENKSVTFSFSAASFTCEATA